MLPAATTRGWGCVSELRPRAPAKLRGTDELHWGCCNRLRRSFDRHAAVLQLVLSIAMVSVVFAGIRESEEVTGAQRSCNQQRKCYDRRSFLLER